MLSQQVVGMARNGWTASIGIDGRHSPDYATGEITIKGLNLDGNLELKHPSGETTILLDRQNGNAEFDGKVTVGNPVSRDPDTKLEVAGKTRTTDLRVDNTMTIGNLTIEGLTQTSDLQVNGVVKKDRLMFRTSEMMW
jgi:hypothetical protein